MDRVAEKERVQTSLSEVRTLVLGVQVLLGFQYRAAFEPVFRSLPSVSQGLSVSALVLLIVSLACLVAPSSFHWITARGHATVRMNAYARRMALVALVPFALAIGANVATALTATISLAAAAALAAASVLVAGLCWFGPALARHPAAQPQEDEMIPLKARISELFTEDRIVLPGVQALLGFQFASYLTEGYAHLPPAAKAVNTASLFLLLLAMVLLMTPAPFHRLAERGEMTERFERVASRLVLGALPPLALGVAGDAYVVVAAVSGETGGLAVAAAAVLALGMATLWFGVPLAARHGLGYGAPHEGSGDRER